MVFCKFGLVTTLDMILGEVLEASIDHYAFLFLSVYQIRLHDGIRNAIIFDDIFYACNTQFIEYFRK